jgi:hypothetical protein
MKICSYYTTFFGWLIIARIEKHVKKYLTYFLTLKYHHFLSIVLTIGSTNKSG